LAMVVDGKPTNLVDMSVMGAQVVSQPILRPNQKLKITLPDEGDEVLCLTAFVAWAAFEKPHNAPAAQFRAGMEFTDAAAQALEAYCRRHCADEPLIPRS
ncbi:MAG TPA: PilZ domain-containing protein, partial [Planctomycetaceae bacterium]|nr:PilZ domain-containing protein [Planctomycetaceae bacterium]